MSNTLYVTKTDGNWGVTMGNLGLSASDFRYKVEKWCNENEVLQTGIEFRMIKGYWRMEIVFINEAFMNLFRTVFSHEATIE